MKKDISIFFITSGNIEEKYNVTMTELPPFSNRKKPYRIDYEEALNASQLEAVTHTEGPLLVIAGAGSGKTRTLTYRVARLVEAGVNPSALLLLTFTRKAAQEMLQRAIRLLDSRCERVSGGTFHSFANAILRKYAAYLSLNSSFAILDRADAESMIQMLRKELELAASYRSFPRKSSLASIFSKSVNKVLPIEEVLYNDYSHFLPNIEAIVELYKAYEKRKREHHFLDFDDLLIYLQMLLKDHPDIRNHISATYQYIMVDEYQDTNKIQAEILYALRAPDAFAAPLPSALNKFEFIDISIDEADNMGCNALILDDKTVVMDTRPLERIAREIERHGIEVIHYDYDAVQDYGGGMRCSHHPVRRVV